MFKEFLTSLTYQIVDFAAKHEDFFKLDAEERAHKVKSQDFPSPFKLYLAKVSPKDFMKDLELIVKFIETPKEAIIKDNAFFKAMVEYFSGKFAQRVDQLDSHFYLASVAERKKQVEEMIECEAPIGIAVRKLLIHTSYQQLCSEIGSLAKSVVNAPHIIVQSPREIDLELRKDIRKKLSEENPLSFPVFQINKKLIGGVRVFKNGEVIDHSWLSRVLRFTSLTAA